MNKLFSGMINHAFFAIGIALGIGLLGMVGLVQIYSYFWEEEEQVAEIDNPVERELSRDQPVGPNQTLHIKRIVGPFYSPVDNEPQGTIFLDIAIDVAGAEQYQLVDENLANLMTRFNESMRETGIGRADLPGEVDYQRLGNTFLVIARDEFQLRGITAVRVSEAEGE